ncbi:MAG: chemotaxis protein CheD [Xylanivirga thermophila]|jgi:chemotaxis protein CheD|uniref:chemotaxis protein CheD n=1 Tax=Xylanivirga thermophila TaxID=2496273 RepID=UPI00101C0393|nr:chemotaxis protein CheD [Xylanivirga thermophila]
MDYQVIKVGMADLNVTISPGVLTTLGLGSCVGIGLYDSRRKIAGLAHIMLPYNRQKDVNVNYAKFADTGIDALIEQMLRLGARQEDITAKIAGGAQMFSFKNKPNSDILKVGQRNVESTIECLNKLNIPILAQDTGGNYGRTVELYAENGAFIIKTIAYGIKEL